MQKEIITEEQQKAARYAKAMGHPIRMYVLELLSKQSCWLQWRLNRGPSDREIDSFAASEGIKRCRIDTGRD